MLVVKLLGVVLVIGYFWGMWKFWKGFRRTNFEPNLPTKLILGALWPALVIFNKSYRKNFQKALKGR